MKISFGSEIKKTAWGTGGNKFLINDFKLFKIKKYRSCLRFKRQ